MTCDANFVSVGISFANLRRCGHCKRLKPEYAKAGELLRGNENGIALAMVDCTEGGKETCSKYSVSGYPTLKIFKSGEVSADYNGPREAGKLCFGLRVCVCVCVLMRAELLIRSIKFGRTSTYLCDKE